MCKWIHYRLGKTNRGLCEKYVSEGLEENELGGLYEKYTET